ncbi:MAG: NADH-quinone oxidoreductase subunit C [Desulfamplus sp.]|nr:NADH-quinone oxidoreductase subunit C [Desulfamplus sp.]
METQFLEISNGTAISRKEIPNLTFDVFRENAVKLVRNNAKIVQFFGYEDIDNDSYKNSNAIKLLAVLRTNRVHAGRHYTLFAATCDAPSSYPSLTLECEPFHLFEREIAEQFGIVPEGHPWLKMVRYHPNSQGRPDVFGNDYAKDSQGNYYYKDDIPGNYPYYSVEGKEIHEVAVGPVHAGVIEPGHFRFNCIGEKVLHLEIQLGYQHRGVEELIPKAEPKRLPIIIESIAGDTSVANAVSFAQVIESLIHKEYKEQRHKDHKEHRFQPDTGAKKIRTIALELERIANHVGDLGALSGDVAFLPPANYFGRMRGDFLNMTLLICGNRFGKGLVRPGGVRFSIETSLREELMRRINELEIQVANVIELLLITTPSVRDRFEDCGVVSRSDAHELGLVGPAGRACGLSYDARRAFPTEYYPNIDIPENAKSTGDVYARATVRADEIMQSIAIIKNLLQEPIETSIENSCLGFKDNQIDKGNSKLLSDFAPDSFVVTINEAWRGELSHSILTDKNGKIIRYKIKDPSFHNWSGLAMSLRNTEISDFPLNNKSYNLSYCGFDL